MTPSFIQVITDAYPWLLHMLVSYLCSTSKIFERLVLNRIMYQAGPQAGFEHGPEDSLSTWIWKNDDSERPATMADKSSALFIIDKLAILLWNDKRTVARIQDFKVFKIITCIFSFKIFSRWHKCLFFLFFLVDLWK